MPLSTSTSPKHLGFYCADLWVLAAILLVGLNDHAFKGSFLPAWFTGKLSDFAGLFFFPFLLYDLWGLLLPFLRRSFLLCALLSGALLTALKLSTQSLLLYQKAYLLLGVHVHIVQDPHDLFALTVLPLACYHFARIRND